MKKLICVLMTGMILLTGCGTQESQETVPAQETAPAETTEVTATAAPEKPDLLADGKAEASSEEKGREPIMSSITEFPVEEYTKAETTTTEPAETEYELNPVKGLDILNHLEENVNRLDLSSEDEMEYVLSEFHKAFCYAGYSVKDRIAPEALDADKTGSNDFCEWYDFFFYHAGIKIYNTVRIFSYRTSGHLDKIECSEFDRANAKLHIYDNREDMKITEEQALQKMQELQSAPYTAELVYIYLNDAQDENASEKIYHLCWVCEPENHVMPTYFISALNGNILGESPNIIID